MSRQKNFPEKIYVGITRTNEMYLIPGDDPVLFITTMRICKTAFYNIGSATISWQGSSKANTPKPLQKHRGKATAKRIPPAKLPLTLPSIDSAGRRWKQIPSVKLPSRQNNAATASQDA